MARGWGIVATAGVFAWLVLGAGCGSATAVVDGAPASGFAAEDASVPDGSAGATAKPCGDGTKPCTEGLACSTGSDCASGVCREGGCAAPSSSDGVKNGAETDVDCGGAACRGTKKCADTKACVIDADCASGVCDAGVCQAPTCNDRATNGTESDQNCGGNCPTKCATGKKCNVNPDCSSSVCSNGVCAAPSCNDSTKNGEESDTDCGGSCTKKCDDGKVCRVGADCVNRVCSGGNAPVCLEASCMDQVQNGLETDVNCGGGKCAACNDNLSCKVDGDCRSSLCQNQKCTPASCPDNRQNQDETDTDCGGANCATRCAAGKKCAVASDCVAGAKCLGPVGAKVCAVDGACGVAKNTCAAGTVTNSSAGACGGTATWTCAGISGGSSMSCSAPFGPCTCALVGVGEVHQSLSPALTNGVWLGNLDPDACARACGEGGYRFCNRYGGAYTGPANGICRGSQQATGVCSGDACGCPGGGCYDRRWVCD